MSVAMLHSLRRVTPPNAEAPRFGAVSFPSPSVSPPFAALLLRAAGAVRDVTPSGPAPASLVSPVSRALRDGCERTRRCEPTGGAGAGILSGCVKGFHRYSSQDRADLMSSPRMGHRQRERVGEVFWTHPAVHGVCFPTRKLAAMAP